MKQLKWKKTEHENRYGVWYKLDAGLRDYSTVMLRAPICIRKLHIDSLAVIPTDAHLEYVNKLYHDDGPCPQKRDCGWIIDVSEFGWNEPLDETFDVRRRVKNPPTLQINSFEEARKIAEERIINHILKFTEKLIKAQNVREQTNV